MADRVFFDTNVLVHAFDRRDPTRRQIASRLLEEALREGTAVLSLQVLQEFYVVSTRKIRLPLPPGRARSIIAEFLRHRVVEPTALNLLQAIDLSIARVLSLWDALIVAVAASADCKVVYTEDLSPGSTLLGVRLVNPFP